MMPLIYVAETRDQMKRPIADIHKLLKLKLLILAIYVLLSIGYLLLSF